MTRIKSFKKSFQSRKTILKRKTNLKDILLDELYNNLYYTNVKQGQLTINKIKRNGIKLGSIDINNIF